MSTSNTSERFLLKSPPLPSEIDSLLTSQILVAWAGERGGDEERRLGWWRTDLVSEYGGRDFFKRLLPRTSEWAVLQSVRQAALRADIAAKKKVPDADALISLYGLSFEVDERLEERIQELKRSNKSPIESLPALRALMDSPWKQQSFMDWVEGHGKSDFTVTATGRRLKGTPPSSLDSITKSLVGALTPIAKDYPFPHIKGNS
jgi:hypothetical protein